MLVENLYQHYRPEEGPFINQVIDWIQQVERTYAPLTTTFLTPREQMIVYQIVAANDEIKLSLSGGFEEAERKQACIYPLYYEALMDDFSLKLLNIKYPLKFGDLSHGKILGTFMSLGIERERIGDIISNGQDWHAIVDDSIVNYLIQNVVKISNVGVQLEVISLDDILESNEEWETVHIVASSLRLDTLLSKVYNFSRQRAKDSVNRGLVKVNFMEMDRPDVEVGIDDIVSLRKFGRFWIQSIDGMTKKDNYRLKVNVLKK